MRKRLFRLAVALAVIAVAATPSTGYAFSCPPLTLTNGLIACHLIGGECSDAEYNCDGEHIHWNVCSLC
jgi:hypothetical protein